MEKVVIFYAHLKYFTAIWFNLWPFGIVCGHLVYFYVLVCLDQEKSGNPALVLDQTVLSLIKELFKSKKMKLKETDK
jgi:hypothetical protein